MLIRDRIIELRRVKASELIPNPKNWRTHPKAQLDAMRGVLAEIGFAGAELAYETDRGLMLIDGHARAEIAGESEIPVLILDVTEAEATKILATFDPLGAMATADAGKLDAILREVETGSEALAAMLTELAAENGLLDELNKGSEVTEDEVPEPPVDPITKPGDLWILGRHRVLCGDSTKAEDVGRLMDGASINIAFTSPPYASQRTYDESSGFKPIPPDEYVKWFEPIAANVKQHLAADGSWFVNIKDNSENKVRTVYVHELVVYHVRKWGWNYVDELCWQRNGFPGDPQRMGKFKNQWEPVFHFSIASDWKFHPERVMKDSDSVILDKNYMPSLKENQGSGSAIGDRKKGAGLAHHGNRLPTFSSGECVGHAAAFPVGLPSFFIKAYTDENDNVFDPFLGSGTTLIAAEQLGRTCFGMEISPAYVDVIIKRWENLTGQKAILEIKCQSVTPD